MRILYCRCAHTPLIPPEVRQAVSTALAGRSDTVAVDDLCALAARRDPRLAEWAGDAQLTVVACHPRAVRGLFRLAGVPLDESRVRFVNLRRQHAPDLLTALDAGAPGPATAETSAPDASPTPADEWVPWFPVIDYARCRQCRQCLSFCLFGVYALSADGKVAVVNPQGCKNNCPACARICPEVAIIFPKLPEAESPLNGDEIGDETPLKARARIDAGKLLGDDIHAALAKRRTEAAARRLKRPALELAERERAAHRPPPTPES